jgi:LuxR family transcriptional regulator, glucitol operon activator
MLAPKLRANAPGARIGKRITPIESCDNYLAGVRQKMAHTIQRLTLYALISALERDLRDFLSFYIAPLVQPKSLLSVASTSKAAERFTKDNPDTVPDWPELLDYLDLGEEIQAIRVHDKLLDQVTRAYIKRYYPQLEGLISTRNRVMHSRPLEFDDFFNVSNLASELVKSHRALWANLRTARRELERDSDFATRIVLPDTADENARILHNLPQVEFDDTGFVAREKELAELRRAILGSYPVVSVVGEGRMTSALVLPATSSRRRSGLSLSPFLRTHRASAWWLRPPRYSCGQTFWRGLGRRFRTL